MGRLRIQLLGNPQVALDDKPVYIRRQKGLALLAFLALNPGPVRRDRLAALLWPESSQANARTSLRGEVLHLNRLLADGMETERETVGLPQESRWLDIEEFERVLSAPADLATLAQATALYQGEFLSGFSLADAQAFDEWQFFQTEAYRRKQAGALGQLISGHRKHGQYEVALDFARKLLALDPLEESVHRDLMSLYGLTGQWAAAVRQYEECVRILDEELGVPPADRTAALFEEVRSRRISQEVGVAEHGTLSRQERILSGQIESPDLPDESAARDGRASHNLPTPPTSFVGRQEELSQVDQMLADQSCRLLTLVGPGGVGKTRLAIAVAIRSRLPVIYVPLQAVSSAEFLSTAIADAAGITLAGPEPHLDQLLHHLHDKQLLVVLDNFEHLLAGTELLADILRTAPAVKLMITSRQTLSVREEWLYPVAGLPVSAPGAEGDPASSDAVKLFGERARQVRHDFRLDDDIEAILSICRATEGIPLAIELATSWLTVLDCADIAERLHRSLDILTTTLRDIPERHQSIRATFDGSWQMLSQEERFVFVRLAVFQPGFTMEAAEVVAGATLPLMSMLVAKSLVHRDADGRYQIHALLRQYGDEKLAETPKHEVAAKRAHSDYYMRFLADRRLLLIGSRQHQIAQEIGGELENVRQAWKWAVDHLELESIRSASGALYEICQKQSRYVEGANLFSWAVRRLETDPMTAERGAALVETLTWYGLFCLRLGRLDDADNALARARHLHNELAIAPRVPFDGQPFTASMFVALSRGDYGQAMMLGEQIFRMAEEAEQPLASSIPHYGMASAALAQEDYARAREHATQAVELAASSGDQWGATFSHGILGQIALAEDAPQTAKRHFEAAYKIGVEFADPGTTAEQLANLADVAVLQQEWPKAAVLFRRSQRLYEEIGDRGGIARTRLGLGTVSQQAGERDAAARHYGAALASAIDAKLTPMIFSILASVGDFFLSGAANHSDLGLRVLSFMYQHPSCDTQIRRRILDSLARAGVSAHALQPGSHTLQALVAAVQAELAGPL